MVVQIKSGKRDNGKSFCCNLYRKRSTTQGQERNCFRTQFLDKCPTCPPPFRRLVTWYRVVVTVTTSGWYKDKNPILTKSGWYKDKNPIFKTVPFLASSGTGWATQGPSWGYFKSQFLQGLSTFDDIFPQKRTNGSKNEHGIPPRRGFCGPNEFGGLQKQDSRQGQVQLSI